MLFGSNDPLWLIRFCKGSTTGLFLGASGTAALDGAPADASVAITVVSRSLGIATPCFCFGGCKGFATDSTSRELSESLHLLEHYSNPRMQWLLRRVLWEQRPLAAAFRWWWRGLCHNRFNSGNLWNCYT